MDYDLALCSLYIPIMLVIIVIMSKKSDEDYLKWNGKFELKTDNITEYAYQVGN